MDELQKTPKITAGEWVLFALCGLLFLVCIVFIDQYETVTLRHRPSRSVLTHRTPRVTTASDVQYIQSWMLFSYINKVFNLPPEYLQPFAYGDSRYPYISIAAVAKEQKHDTAASLALIKDAVTSFIALSLSR